MSKLLFFLSVLLFTLGGALRAASEAVWRVENIVPAPNSQGPRGFTATVRHLPSTRLLELTSELHLTRIDRSFVSGTKLIVLGEAGKAGGVSIFDLQNARELDWFYCYAPRLVSENWIVYVEFYYAHQAGEPTDVVLVYDLMRSSTDNRMEKDRGASDKLDRIHVGAPTFPESNARLHTYDNVVSDVTAARHVLGPPFYVLLPPSRLLFTASQGTSAVPNLLNYLVVVDLSEGVLKPRIHQVDIPHDKIKHESGRANYIEITRMEAISANAVRLYIPEDKYGVSSFIVNIPE
jgi:hypothetical protein